MFGKSRSMGFVIQIVAGNAPPRPRTGVLGRGWYAARRDLGAKPAIRDFFTTT
ncbi:hypothetical protein LWC35_07720 [Pseudonocardia kujensis]|uniref:hypothetical protein n=1 Tax=Pseudonocardia kujensis TaxID=1128675 RepID=UPI001E503CC6|nr:hypothetical protein [Pseudonocardia kujensis]MCE0762799.1 hypothetical protein [Pseudonocardia kujensis]